MAEILRDLPSLTLNSRPKIADELRELAAWYQDYAERAGNPAFWEARPRTAEEMEARANQLQVSSRNATQ